MAKPAPVAEHATDPLLRSGRSSGAGRRSGRNGILAEAISTFSSGRDGSRDDRQRPPAIHGRGRQHHPVRSQLPIGRACRAGSLAVLPLEPASDNPDRDMNSPTTLSPIPRSTTNRSAATSTSSTAFCRTSASSPSSGIQFAVLYLRTAAARGLGDVPSGLSHIHRAAMVGRAS
jgi:hypothetical protein